MRRRRRRGRARIGPSLCLLSVRQPPGLAGAGPIVAHSRERRVHPPDVHRHGAPSAGMDERSVFSDKTRMRAGARRGFENRLSTEELLPVVLNRRFLTCVATIFALLIGSSGAVAATHATHATHKTRISGVIVSINATRHTLKLRVTHGIKHHKV